MKSEHALIISTRPLESIHEVLQEHGYATSAASSLQQAIACLRRKSASRVLIDAENAPSDVLELVLNVRDIDEGAPIMVLGEVSDTVSAKALKRQPSTRVFRRPRTAEAMKELILHRIVAHGWTGAGTGNLRQGTRGHPPRMRAPLHGTPEEIGT